MLGAQCPFPAGRPNLQVAEIETCQSMRERERRGSRSDIDNDCAPAESREGAMIIRVQVQALVLAGLCA